MKTLKKIQDFVKTNKIPLDPTKNGSIFDAKYAVAQSALNAYFNTFENKFGISRYFDSQTLSQNVSLSTKFTPNYFDSIIYGHLFMELMLKEIILGVDVRLLDGNFPAWTLLSKDWKKDYTPAPKTIDVNALIQHVKWCIKHPDELRIRKKKKSHILGLSIHLDSIEVIRYLRNDAIHRGTEILKQYAYEVVMVNYLIPLIHYLIRDLKNNYLLERKTNFGKSIIDELTTIKLPLAITQANKDDIIYRLNFINHLKAIGSAAHRNPLFTFEGAPKKIAKTVEKGHNQHIRQQGRDLANFLASKLPSQRINICPCCGTPSLVSLDMMQVLGKDSAYYNRAFCTVCSYEIHQNMDEPCNYGIMDKKVFSLDD